MATILIHLKPILSLSSLRLQLVNAGNKVHASFKGGINSAVIIHTEKTL